MLVTTWEQLEIILHTAAQNWDGQYCVYNLDIRGVYAPFDAGAFHHTYFIDCSLTDCNFKRVTEWSTSFHNCVITNSTLPRVRRIDRCKLKEVKCVFDMAGGFITNSTLAKTDFSGIDMNHVEFSNSQLTECLFVGTWVMYADFRKSTLVRNVMRQIKGVPHGIDLLRVDGFNALKQSDSIYYHWGSTTAKSEKEFRQILNKTSVWHHAFDAHDKLDRFLDAVRVWFGENN